MGARDGGVGDFGPIEQQDLPAAGLGHGNVARIGPKARDAGGVNHLARALESAKHQQEDRRMVTHAFYSIRLYTARRPVMTLISNTAIATTRRM